MSGNWGQACSPVQRSPLARKSEIDSVKGLSQIYFYHSVDHVHSLIICETYFTLSLLEKQNDWSIKRGDGIPVPECLVLVNLLIGLSGFLARSLGFRPPPLRPVPPSHYWIPLVGSSRRFYELPRTEFCVRRPDGEDRSQILAISPG
jgi:hypothetical protein